MFSLNTSKNMMHATLYQQGESKPMSLTKDNTSVENQVLHQMGAL